jgi:hypothetical protein
MKICVQIKIDENNEIDRCVFSFDKEGLEYIRDMLGAPHLRKNGDHVHLFTEDWGGYGLSSQSYFEGFRVINHLELHYLGGGEDISD